MPLHPRPLIRRLEDFYFSQAKTIRESFPYATPIEAAIIFPGVS